MMKQRDWAYLDPKTNISDEKCLVMTTNASDTAVAVTLFRVKLPDASTVTKEDLVNPEMAQIIGVGYKKLTDSQL